MDKRMLTPAETCESFYAVGERKASLPLGRMLMLAIFGGMFIALAGAASTWASMLVENPSIKRLIAGCIFPAGLAMVVLTGAELFTGNNLMTIALLEKRITLKGVLRNWCVVYLGNFIGAAFVAACVVWGGSFAGNESVLISTAAGKILPWGQAFLRGILCNILVSLGVLMAATGKDAAGKVVALFFPVAAFIIVGYEHCVANMYYFTAGLLAGGEISLAEIIFSNMIPVTLGNITGGGLVLGAGFWYAYRSGK